MPCPFCGESWAVAYFKIVNGKEVWLTACECCHCDGPVGDGLSKEESIKAWNTRTDLTNRQPERINMENDNRKLDDVITSPPATCSASPFNLVAIILLPVFIACGIFMGAWKGLQLWCHNMAHNGPGEWTLRLPK